MHAAVLRTGGNVQPVPHRQLPGPPGLVLGYAANAPSVIAQGIAHRDLGRALNDLA
ncbi:hypothetical protein [Fodinicola feengrottensis]|uniref:hypothetical protein n=1 Tax=Fodinicola feengrottensis TaxID=435914 RepID=UPI0013D18F13|nr:hypothetical protein [Fodinicola feengrottensis]